MLNSGKYLLLTLAILGVSWSNYAWSKTDKGYVDDGKEIHRENLDTGEDELLNTEYGKYYNLTGEEKETNRNAPITIKMKFVTSSGESIEVENKDASPIDWNKYLNMPIVKCVIYDNEIQVISEKCSKNKLKLKVRNNSLRFRQTKFVYKNEDVTSSAVITSGIALYCVTKGLIGGSLAVWREYEDTKNSDFLTYAEKFSTGFTKSFISSFVGIYTGTTYVSIASCIVSSGLEIDYLYSNVAWSDFTGTSWRDYLSFFKNNFALSDWTSIFWNVAGCVGVN